MKVKVEIYSLIDTMLHKVIHIAHCTGLCGVWKMASHLITETSKQKS